MWGQLSSLTATLVEKANELVDEVGQDVVRGGARLIDEHGSATATPGAAPVLRLPSALPRRRCLCRHLNLLRPGAPPGPPASACRARRGIKWAPCFRHRSR